MSFVIHFDELFIPGQDCERLALTLLDDDHSHIHGGLRIVIDGRPMPYLGFFGPDDVCLNDWVNVLFEATKRLQSDVAASYVFDECEQGQPVFEFQRNRDQVLVSVINSELGDGLGDQNWQHVTCEMKEFVAEVNQFLSELKVAVEIEAGGKATEQWWRQIGVAT